MNHNVDPMNQEQVYFCVFCNGPGTSKHHLIPQEILKQRDLDLDLHFRRTVRSCRKCHRAIHDLFSNEELADDYYTLELLRPEFERRLNL